jgi:hypothetical protein
MTTSSSFCPVNPSYWFFQSIQFIHFLDDSENERPLTLEKNEFQSCHSRPPNKGWISRASRHPVAISWYSSIGISLPVPGVGGNRALEKGRSELCGSCDLKALLTRKDGSKKSL